MTTDSELLKEATDNLEKATAAADERARGVVSRMDDLEQHVAMMPTGGGTRVGNSGPSLAHSFTSSDSFRAMVGGANSSGRVQLEAPMNAITNPGQLGTDHDTQSQRADGIFGDPRRSLSILDLLPKLKVETKTFEYLRLAGYTNDAAFQINEGDQKSESDMPTELVDAEICTIAHFVRASAQIIDDQPALAGQINNLLTYGVRAKLENSIIRGLEPRVRSTD